MKIIFAILVGGALLVLAPAAMAQMGAAMGMSASNMPQADPQQAYSAGVAAYRAHNYAEAIRQLRIAHRAIPNNAGVNYALGLAYAGADQKQDAKTSFTNAIHGANPPPDAWLQLGSVSLELGDRATAVEQQTALQALITHCDAACGDVRRAQLQAASDGLARALSTPPA